MHVIKLCAVGALCQLVATTAQAQQPTTLTLACKGTASEYRLPPYPNEDRSVSMSLIVNLTDRTVRGFEWPFDTDPLKITDVGDVEVIFGGDEEGGRGYSIIGRINRVTGDVWALTSFVQAGGIERYWLQCKPTQRMF